MGPLKNTCCSGSIIEILWCIFQLDAYEMTSSPFPTTLDFGSQQFMSIQEVFFWNSTKYPDCTLRKNPNKTILSNSLSAYIHRKHAFFKINLWQNNYSPITAFYWADMSHSISCPLVFQACQCVTWAPNSVSLELPEKTSCFLNGLFETSLKKLEVGGQVSLLPLTWSMWGYATASQQLFTKKLSL